MRIAVYAIAHNDEVEIDGWCEATNEADHRVVLDTGSTDCGVRHLEQKGVAVHRAIIHPWRCDDALNAAVALLPADVEVCFRVDMHDRLRLGWRTLIEQSWLPDTGSLRHRYQATSDHSYYHQRVHSRFEFRWSGPFRPSLTWRGEGDILPVVVDNLIVERQPRTPRQVSYLPLLQEGVQENPSDPKRAFWLADALLDEGCVQEGISEINRYITLAGSAGEGTAFLLRKLALADEMDAFHYLQAAQTAHPSASNHLAFAEQYFRRQEWGNCYLACQYAISLLRSAPRRVLEPTDDPRLRGPRLHDLMAASAWNLWDFEAAYGHAVEAVRRAPQDDVLIAHLNQIHAKIQAGGTLDPNMENTDPPAAIEPQQKSGLTVIHRKRQVRNIDEFLPTETIKMESAG